MCPKLFQFTQFAAFAALPLVYVIASVISFHLEFTFQFGYKTQCQTMQIRTFLFIVALTA